MSNDTTRLDNESLGELLLLALDGSISEEQFKGLQNEIINNPEVQDYYYDFLTVYVGLSSYGCSGIPVLSPDETADDYVRLLGCLAEEENRAPAAKILKEEPERELIEKVVYPPREKRKISRFSIAALLFSAAAVLFFVIFVRLSPYRSGREVATLTDTLNAKWADPIFPMEAGVRLMTGDPPFLLREGFAELIFDNDVKVVLEAPAEFQILADDQIKLNYGRIYSVVPEQGYGFTVCAAGSRIIDLGTEFGVQADMYGDVELHVIKGKANLLSGVGGQKINQEISAGFAGELDGATGQLQMLSCDDRLFTRQISSESSLIWRGQGAVDLADIVGNGNGFGTGSRSSYLNPANGQWKRLTSLLGGPKVGPGDRTLDTRYNLVPSTPFVDGIFVPNGQNGPITVSSSGHMFTDVPPTSSRYWYGVVNWDAAKAESRSVVLDGTLYGTTQHPALLMHSNIGITFDLYAIRQNLSGHSITEFSSVYGVSDAYGNKNVQPHADFWVLVDGELKFSKKDLTINQTGTIRIPISPVDRYLTLVSTEGTGNSSTGRGPIYNDWCVWGSPVLKIE